ncbi:MAG: metallophosphoesterase, partial [Kiloniellales bacterium]|nr:metallophosphoesterase [Kiloniellales bacterium]
MLIAQISDLHIRAEDGPGPLGIRVNENLIQAITQLNALEPRPDLVVATGDLTASGEPGQYRRLEEILRALELPLFLIAGNHDETAPFCE